MSGLGQAMHPILNCVEFRTNPEPYMVQGVVHNSWRRAPCKVHGCHEPYVVRGGESGSRTHDPVISGIHDFQSCPFGLSGISPFQKLVQSSSPGVILN